MIVIEREISSDEVETKRLDHLVNDAMLERGYVIRGVGNERGSHFQKFAANPQQEDRDFHLGIIADSVVHRVSGVFFQIRLEP